MKKLINSNNNKGKLFSTFPIQIDQRAVFRLQGYVKSSDKPDNQVMHSYYDMLDIAVSLFETRGIYTFQEIKKIDKENGLIELTNGTILYGINIARTFIEADYIAIGLTTIGSALEEKVASMFANDELAAGLMLDCIGSEAAEGAAQFIDSKIDEHISLFNYNRTPRMSPGYGSFEITQQKQLFQLIDSNKVKITLASSSIMIPQKSVSFIIGCGKNVKHYSTLSPCRVCDVRDCQMRDHNSNRCQA